MRVSNLYCLFDKVSKQYLPTFHQSNDDSAKREIMSIFNKETKLQPEDYELFLVARIEYIENESNEECSMKVYVVEDLNQNVIDFMRVKK